MGLTISVSSCHFVRAILYGFGGLSFIVWGVYRLLSDLLFIVWEVYRLLFDLSFIVWGG